MPGASPQINVQVKVVQELELEQSEPEHSEVSLEERAQEAMHCVAAGLPEFTKNAPYEWNFLQQLYKILSRQPKCSHPALLKKLEEFITKYGTGEELEACHMFNWLSSED